MIITQSGVSSPFAFAGSGDEYVVTGVITNLGDTSTDVILSAFAGNKITNQGQIPASARAAPLRWPWVARWPIPA